MPSPLFSLIKGAETIFNRYKRISIALILIVLISTQFPLLQHIAITQAADTISSQIHTFNYAFPTVQDTTNAPPGVILRHGDQFGFFAQITNNSAVFSATSPDAQIEMPSLVDFDIVTGGMSSYTDLDCRYVVQTTGTLNYNADYFGAGTSCTISIASGTDIHLAGTSSIGVGQTGYFRLTGMQAQATTPFSPFVLAAKGSGKANLNSISVNTGQPSTTYLKIGDATISGSIFYDNGTPVDADNGTKQLSESLVTTPGSVTAVVSDGTRSYTGLVDGSGNYSVRVPENNEVGATVYFMATPIIPSGFRVTTPFSSTWVLPTGDSATQNIGINNQTDLSISMTGSPGTATQGSAVQFDTTISNHGPAAATNVHVSIPSSGSNYSYLSSLPPSGTTYNSSTGEWIIPVLPSGGNLTIYITISLSGSGTVNFTAEVTGMDTPISDFGSPDQNSVPNNHQSAEDDQFTSSVSVTAATRIDGMIFEDTHENHTYNGPTDDPGLLNVTVNLYDTTGPETFVASTLTDADGQYQFNSGIIASHNYQVRIVDPAGYDLTLGDNTQDITNAVSGAVYTLDFVGYFHPGSISGMVFIDSNYNNFRDGGENAGLSNINVDLLTNTGALVSSQLTNGAGQYSFPDLHAGGYILDFATPTNYGYVTPNIGPTDTDSDIIASSGYTGILDVVSNSISANIDAGLNLQNADLTISKSADRTNPLVGDAITYTIRVYNNGPLNSSGSIVTDILPSEVEYVSSHTRGAGGGGTFDNNTGRWSLPQINSGEESFLDITVQVMSGSTFRNTASITTSAQPDSDSSNNSSFVDVFASMISPSPTPSGSPSPSTSPTPTTTPTPTISPSPTATPTPSNSPSSSPSPTPSATPSAQASLTINKYVLATNSTPGGESSDNSGGPQVRPGSELTYYIDVSNDSGITAHGIVITDTLPSALNSSGWTCAATVKEHGPVDHDINFPGPCELQSNGTLSGLPSNLSNTDTLHIRLSNQTAPTQPGELCNTASVQADQVNTISDRACIVVIAPALSLTKTASPSQVIPGGTVTYSLTVTNNGTSPANNVEIIDDLANTDLQTNLIPSCVLSTRQITILDDGAFTPENPNAIHWNIGTLAAGQSTTVHLRAEIRNDLTASTNCRNTAVTGGSNVSTTQANVTIRVPVITPAGAALTFTKEAINARNNYVFVPGEHVQYRLTVNNTGEQNSESLTIRDPGNSPYLKNNTAQTSGGIINSINPLVITDLLVSGGRNHVANYDATITSADHFPLTSFKLHKNADKTDKDFYPEKVQTSRLRSNNDSSPSDILNAPDGNGVILGSRGSITLSASRSGKVIVDGDGDDFCLATLNVQANTRYRVSVSQSDNQDTFEELGTSNGKNNCFDLSDADINWARYVKIEDRSNSTSTITSFGLDAVCLLHIGGLIDNTANLSTDDRLIGSSTSTIVVDFTDIFDSPLSPTDCRTKKQARVSELQILPLPPIVEAAIVEPLPLEQNTPIELPKTGSETALVIILSSSLGALQWYRTRRRNKQK